jgi:hypothetical protein
VITDNILYANASNIVTDNPQREVARNLSTGIVVCFDRRTMTVSVRGRRAGGS